MMSDEVGDEWRFAHESRRTVGWLMSDEVGDESGLRNGARRAS